MRVRTMVAYTAVAALAFSFSTALQANAGPTTTTYPVEIGPNGVGACPSTTGNGLGAVTTNSGNSPMTIQCATPGGFAWGRNLDTPDAAAVSATVVDDGTDVALGWTPGNSLNSSRGRMLGLGLRVGDMRVGNTALTLTDDEAGFASDFPTLPNGKISKRANLSMRVPRAAWMLDGTARCKNNTDSSTGIKWENANATGNARKNWTATVIIECPTATSGTNGTNANAGNFKETGSVSMSPGDTPKQMTKSVACASGQAIAGGYDISASTTSQWPQVLYNGPDTSTYTTGTDAGTYKATAWKVVVGVPSQSSSSAKAVLNVWVTCSTSN